MIGRTSRIKGWRELTLISKQTDHRHSRACDGSSTVTFYTHQVAKIQSKHADADQTIVLRTATNQSHHIVLTAMIACHIFRIVDISQ